MATRTSNSAIMAYPTSTNGRLFMKGGRPFPVTLRLAQAGRDRLELGRKIRANARQRGDHDDSDESSDQAVFDGRGAGLVADEARKEVGHDSLHFIDTLGCPPDEATPSTD